MNLSFLVLLAAAIASTSVASADGSADQILDRYTEALGGRAAVDAVTTRVMRGCYLPTSETPCVPFDVYAKNGDKWKTVMTSPGILVVERVSNGEKTFELQPGGERAFKAEAAFDTALGFNFDVGLHPRKHFDSFRSTGPNRLEATAKSGQKVTLEFDAATGLLQRIGNHLFENYRDVDGVKTPSVIARARTNTRYLFTDIRNSAPIDDSVFTPEHYKQSLAAMRRIALDEAARGIDMTAAERAALESLEFFSPHEGRMLFDLIRQRGYKRGLEIGTAWGNSAIWMAMAFKRNGGQLVTIEIQPEFAKRARENFAKAEVEGAIDSRVGDALKEIPNVKGEFDLVFMDTGTNFHRKFLDMVYSRVKPGGAVISHNADTFERDQPDFRRAVMEDPQLETSLILTPGGGLSVSIRRPRG